jgi:hypothetical protein
MEAHEFNDGGCLGKYLSRSAADAVLRNGTLKWSRPSGFNDPFDSIAFPRFSPAFDIVYGFAVEEFRKVLRNEAQSLSISNPTSKLISMMRMGLEQGLASISEYQEHFEQLVRDFLQTGDTFAERYHTEVAAKLEDLKICCFTKNFLNDQMWAHYAEDFKGVLLIFSPANSDSIFIRSEQVAYSDEPYFIFDADEFGKVITGQSSMADREFVGRAVTKIILNKKTGWSYEKEWRINFGSGRLPDEEIEYLPYDNKDLFAVCVGLRSPPDFVEEVSNLARSRNPGVKLFRSTKHLKTNSVSYSCID